MIHQTFFYLQKSFDSRFIRIWSRAEKRPVPLIEKAQIAKIRWSTVAAAARIELRMASLFLRHRTTQCAA